MEGMDGWMFGWDEMDEWMDACMRPKPAFST